MNPMKCFFQIAFLVLLVSSNVNAKLYEVTEKNWERLLSSDEWMVKFYAPWCPACKRFEPVWKEFSDKSDQLKIKVGSADVNANPILSGLFSVTSLPTVYHIKEGQYRVYNGSRDLQTLSDFIVNKEWKNIDPSSSWLTPNSFLIRIFSLLFKATLYFKDLYTHLTDSYGLPIWAVLGIFAVVTIMLGLALGIALIICIDCVFPPKHYNPEELTEHQELIDNEEDEDESVDKDSEKKSNGDKANEESPTKTNSNVKRRAKAKKDY